MLFTLANGSLSPKGRADFSRYWTQISDLGSICESSDLRFHQYSCGWEIDDDVYIAVAAWLAAFLGLVRSIVSVVLRVPAAANVYETERL